MQLHELLQAGQIWRGRTGHNVGTKVAASGWHVLDDLIGGGWPEGALTEILSAEQHGISLLLPVLAHQSQRSGRWLVWVAPPHLPYAPALAAHGVAMQRVLLIHEVDDAQRLWAAEQALKSAACAVVMLWPGRVDVAQLRRLQLAAEQGACIGVVFRRLRDSAQHSPAALRLRVLPSPIGLEVEVLKRRGGWGGESCCVRVSS